MWASLRQDRIVGIALVVVGLLTVPFLVPVLSGPALKWFSLYFANLPLIAVAIAAFQHGRDRIEAPAERRFVDAWTAGLGCWLAQEVVASLTAGNPGPGVTLVQDGLYLAFYVCLVLGVRLRPDLGPEPPPWSLLHRLEALATGGFALGLFAYFAVIPARFAPALFRTDVPSLVLYLILDGLLLLHLGAAARAARTARWRVLYRWLLAAAALWLVTDGIEVMMAAEVLPPRPSGSTLDMIWWLPFVPLVVAARLRERWGSAGDAEEAAPAEAPEPWGDPLVGYAALFPVMHFLVYGSGAFDQATRRPHEVVALVVLLLLGGLAVANERRLVAENRGFGELRLRAIQVEHRAYHDALTGLPNRYLLQDRLELALPRARRNRTRLAVLFLDLDRFKVVNDSLGHTTGDRLLREVADRLAPQVRKGDTLARLGGDEFTVLVEAVHHVEDTAKVAHKLRDALREPFFIDGRELYVTVSIGISLFPDDGTDAESLLMKSDVAMYRAKEHGRDGYQLYRAEMNERAEERLALESALRKALPLGQLRIQYLPIVEVASGRTTGCEALLRWQHPEKGLLLPQEFLELAEITGVIVDVGPWMLRTACRQAREWRQQGVALQLAVNLSRRQFLDADLAPKIALILAEEELPPDQLELEITESLAMQNAELTGRTLRALRALGVRLSIDDFGTGYSSLSYLKKFPIDTLKIDRAFVREIDTDPGDATIATTVLAMARTLGLSVMAEGVERAEQLRVLKGAGCDRAQGHLFSPPLWPEELPESLRERESRQ